MTTYDQIVRDACVKANPDIRVYENRCMTCGYGFEFCKCVPKQTEWYQDRPLTLADILLAIKESKTWGVVLHRTKQTDEELNAVLKNRSDILGKLVQTYWNLRTNWNGQTEETKQFIANLLS